MSMGGRASLLRLLGQFVQPHHDNLPAVEEPQREPGWVVGGEQPVAVVARADLDDLGQVDGGWLGHGVRRPEYWCVQARLHSLL